MTTDQILALLIAERDKLNRAIEALGIPVKRRGRPPKNAELLDFPAPKRRKMSAATRKKMAAAQKKRWAEKKG